MDEGGNETTVVVDDGDDGDDAGSGDVGDGGLMRIAMTIVLMV